MAISWLQWIRDYYVADIAAILGLIVAFLGFGYTIKQVREAKSAAEQAREEVKSIRKLLAEMNTIASLSSAMSLMEEVKTLQRIGAWDILPDRYSTLRQCTYSIRSSYPHLTEENARDLSSAADQFSIIEHKIELYLAGKSKDSPPNVPRLNNIVSKQMDKFNQLLTESKQKIGV